jgi:hypothetical protein
MPAPGRQHRASPIGNEQSLALIGSASARDVGVSLDVDAEALSITRLEGSHWRSIRLQPGLKPRSALIGGDGPGFYPARAISAAVESSACAERSR